MILYLTNFDVVIQLITASFFALSGLNFFEKNFISEQSAFRQNNDSIFRFVDVVTDPTGYKIKLYYKLVRFKCYYNLMTSLYPNRFNEIFYKGGVFGLFLLLFIAFLKSDSVLYINRLIPVTIYSFISVLLLSRRLFTKIEDHSIISEMVLGTENTNFNEFIYPFKKNKKKYLQEGHYLKIIYSYILYLYRFINPKFIGSNGRNIFLRCLLHTIILFFLLHLNWFGLDYGNIPILFKKFIYSIFNQDFILNLLPFQQNNFIIIFTAFIIVVFLSPYLLLVTFYAKNSKTHKKMESEASKAYSFVKEMNEDGKQETSKMNKELRDRLKQAKEKAQ